MEDRIKKALEFAWSYGQTDGEYQKLWVIDQMVRALCGSKEEYAKWVQAYEIPFDDGNYYQWETGIAP